MDLNEARKNLELVLSENLKAQYFKHLREWFLFSSKTTKDEFDEKVRSLLQNSQQIECHNHFILALLQKTSSTPKPVRQNNKGVFETPDYADYVKPKHLNQNIPLNYTNPRAAAELFVPYSGFISCKINIVAWECGMEGADREVTQLVVHACQTFLKNIIMAMITKAKGYKIRDGKFQYGFNMPIADPFLRNTNKLSDDSLESNVAVKDDILIPKGKKSLERMEFEISFAYAANQKIKTNVTLNTKLLYETIRENPSLFGQHGVHSVSVLKLSLFKDHQLSGSEPETDSDS